MRPRNRRLLALASALAGVAAAGAAPAADWRFDPSVEAGALTNDNYTLARGPVPKLSVSGAFLDALGTLKGIGPRSDFLIEPRVHGTWLSGNSDQNSKDYYLRLGANGNTQLTRFGVSANYSDEFVVDSELRDAQVGGGGLGQAGGPDAGRIVGNNRRKLGEIDPFVQFTLNERTRLRFDAGYQDVSFDSNFPGSQVSYKNTTGGATLARDVSQASSLSVILQYTRFDPDIGATADTQSARVQWDYRVAERLRAYVRAGVDRAKGSGTAGTTADFSKTSQIGGVGLQWTFPRSEIFVDVLRDVDANATGFIVARNEERLWVTHRFTTRLTGYGALYATQEESVRSTFLYLPRHYETASLGLEWRLLRQLSLGGRVAYSHQKFSGEPFDANGTSAEVSLTWRPNRVD
jgi:hypothetical protein